MFAQLSQNYELGLVAYVFTYVFLCLPIVYLIYKTKKEKRK